MSMKLRRNYPLLLLLLLVSAFFTLALGNQRIIAYTVPGASQFTRQGYDFSSDVALFDDGVVHSIAIQMDEDDYQKMITTYQETGLKEYFYADVVIDGVQVKDVGIRLKGNASLRTAVGGRGGMQMGGFGGGRGEMQFDPQNMPEIGQNRGERPTREDMPVLPFGEMPDREGMPAPPMGEMPDRGIMPAAPGGQLPDFQNMPGETNADQIGQILIPFMIKFNQFVEGQTYQGYSLLAIRTYGTSYDEAKLQEPVTNAIFRQFGQPASQTAYAGVQLNDADELFYVISEVIDDAYLEKHFANPNGVLYKAEIGSTLSYQGEDPSQYAASFTQQTRKNDADLAPLIDFIRFISEADEATFEEELPVRFDVDAFATYLAINNLLVNTDSIAGMNNNYYLYYDDETGQFSLLMWDANESLGKLNFGGGQSSATYDIYYAGSQVRRGGPGGGSNTLVTRFLENPTFKALYEQKLKEVYQAAYVSGAIASKVDEYASMIRAANSQRPLIDLQAYEQAVDSLLVFIEQRQQYLAGTSLLVQ